MLLRQPQRRQQAERDGLAVAVAVVAGRGLDAVADGVAEVEGGAHPQVALVLGHHRAACGRRSARMRSTSSSVGPGQRRPRLDPASNSSPPVEQAVLDDLGEPARRARAAAACRARRCPSPPARAARSRRRSSCPRAGRRRSCRRSPSRPSPAASWARGPGARRAGRRPRRSRPGRPPRPRRAATTASLRRSPASAARRREALDLGQALGALAGRHRRADDPEARRPASAARARRASAREVAVAHQQHAPARRPRSAQSSPRRSRSPGPRWTGKRAAPISAQRVGRGRRARSPRSASAARALRPRRDPGGDLVGRAVGVHLQVGRLAVGRPRAPPRGARSGRGPSARGRSESFTRAHATSTLARSHTTSAVRRQQVARAGALEGAAAEGEHARRLAGAASSRMTVSSVRRNHSSPRRGEDLGDRHARRAPRSPGRRRRRASRRRGGHPAPDGGLAGAHVAGQQRASAPRQPASSAR